MITKFMLIKKDIWELINIDSYHEQENLAL